VSRSLRSQLAIGLALGFVTLAGAQWLLTGLAVERMLKNQLGQRLERDAENLLAALEQDADGILALDTSRVGGEYQLPFSGHYFRIVTGSGRDIASRSLWDSTLALPGSTSARLSEHAAPGPQGQSLWALVARYEKRGQVVHIVVAEDLAPLRASLREWHVLYGALTLLVIALVLLVQQWRLRRALAPIERLGAQMAELQSGRRDGLDIALPSEIAPLVEQLNALLGVFGRRARRSRDALGNLAHALKTRLAVMVQAADSDELAGHPELRKRLADSAELMRRAIERELRRARLMGGAHPAQRSRVREAVDALARTLAVLHGERMPRMDIRIAPEIELVMDPEDLMELLGNLMDNACSWARTRVCVTLHCTPEPLLTVEDDGPGCPPDVLRSLSERGFRADESKPGHGLGLAIVRDLVDSYGGALEFDRSDLGGLRVSVHLPATLAREGD
jgi:signal transduction histidine kinase